MSTSTYILAALIIFSIECRSQDYDSLDRNAEVLSGKLTKAMITDDSSIFINADIKHDHRIFGYSLPNVKSKRLILFSVFTNDVKDNPYKCPLGAYYGTSNMKESEIKYLGQTKYFIKAKILAERKETIIYFEKKWISFLKN